MGQGHLTFQAFELSSFDVSLSALYANKSVPIARRTTPARIAKKTLDLVFVALAIPVIVLTGFALLALNPALNPGPLMFRQARMGLNGRKFMVWKFRTMAPSQQSVRAHDDRVEDHRISRFSRFLRRSRIDEFPNFINVLIGDMSLIGPRPDAWDHAIQHIAEIPRYRDRFRVLPGITGLAQVHVGYADCKRATTRKARFDLFYLRHMSFRFDLYILSRTFVVLFTGFGAK